MNTTSALLPPSLAPPTVLPIPVSNTPPPAKAGSASAAPVQNNTALIVELMQCKECGKNLISGFCKDRTVIPNNNQFNFISRYTDTSHLIELSKPGSWIIQDKNLVGGPLGANVLPNKYKAEVDRVDKVYFRPLTCQCETSIGTVICDVLDGGNKAYVGKVHLWQSAVQVTTRKPVVARHTKPVESEYEHIPSSQ